MAQFYTVTSVEDTKFEPSPNGSRFYNVGFEGQPGKYLWSTKTRPEVNSRAYGHIEPSKSGKSMLFKRDKEEGAPYQQNSAASGFAKSPKKSDDERSDDIRWGLCLKEANLYITKYEEGLDEDQWADAVNKYANALYKVSHGPDPEKKDGEMSQDEINALFDQAGNLPL